MALIDKLTAIGDAIRTKTGKSDTLTLEQMAEAVAGISVGENLPEAESAYFGGVEVEYGILSESMNSSSSVGSNRGYRFTMSETMACLGIRVKFAIVKTYDTYLHLWDAETQTTIATGTIISAIANEWLEYRFAAPINLLAGKTYAVSAMSGIIVTGRSNEVTLNPKLTNVAWVNAASGGSYPSQSMSNPYCIDIIIKPVQAPLPDDYQITRTTMDDIAEEVQRITGTTGKLSTAQIVTALQGINTSLQSKTVTPTNESQTVTADSGYYGLSSVTVEEISEDNEHVAEIINEKMEVVVNDTY